MNTAGAVDTQGGSGRGKEESVKAEDWEARKDCYENVRGGENEIMDFHCLATHDLEAGGTNEGLNSQDALPNL